MQTLKELFVAYVVGEASARAAVGRPLRVLDVGCGTAAYVPGLVAQFPDLVYVGIEPIEQSFAAAQIHTRDLPQATVHFGLAYDALEDYQPASFDLVMSLSVLEHVKQLPPFIAFCDRYLAAGGLMVHRYDLGHALAPHSWKEWLHVRLGNNVPWVLPETQFVRYVPEAEVRAVYEQHQITPCQTTYHQMPNHKLIEKHVPADSIAVAGLFAWETAHQAEFAAITTPVREKLFPAIAVWGTKAQLAFE
jgi:2-polyprenyl-3-methyl-5-hydroxy-6-metoxy-1,4-benzoquinol methylase